jgi:hypothetical protein
VAIQHSRRGGFAKALGSSAVHWICNLTLETLSMISSRLRNPSIESIQAPHDEGTLVEFIASRFHTHFCGFLSGTTLT